MAKPSENTVRSGCPVSLGLDLFGDRWTLLIVRDLMFRDKRHFREFLGSDEHISSNILTDRLKGLVVEGIVSRSGDPDHAQKVTYRLTEKGIALLPILMQIGQWSAEYCPVAEEYILPGEAAPLPAEWTEQMDQLRAVHLNQPQ